MLGLARRTERKSRSLTILYVLKEQHKVGPLRLGAGFAAVDPLGLRGWAFHSRVIRLQSRATGVLQLQLVGRSRALEGLDLAEEGRPALFQAAGRALVAGMDVTREMDTIYTVLGICPQFDTVWRDLTVREHLLAFARVKGMPWQQQSKGG